MESPAYVVNVDAAVVRDGEYLCIERSDREDHAPGTLGFPGGTVEQPPGEADTFEATARRELREEVGVEVASVEYVHSGTFAADDGTTCINVVTLCPYAGGRARPRDPAEVAAVHWLAPEAIRDREDAPAYLRTYVDRLESVRNDGD